MKAWVCVVKFESVFIKSKLYALVVLSIIFLIGLENPAWSNTNRDNFDISYWEETFESARENYSENIKSLQFQNGSSLGFKANPIWFRITLPKYEGLRILSIQPIHLDRISIFTSDGVNIYEGGDTVVSPKSLIANGYTIELSDELSEQNLYIRLQSKNIIQIYFRLNSVDDIFALSLNGSLVSTVAIAVTFFYLAWMLSAFLVARDTLVLIFMLRLLAFFITALIHSGLARQLIFQDTLMPQDWLHNISALTYISIAQAFDYCLLNKTRETKVVQAFGLFVLGSFLFKMYFYLIGSISISLLVNNVTALFTLIIGLVTSVYFYFNKGEFVQNEFTLGYKIPVFYFLLQSVPLIVLFFLTFSENIDYRPYEDLAFFNYAIVPGGLITYALALKQKQNASLREQLEIERNVFESEWKIELEKRQDMKNLLEMLAHEIRNPLSTLKMAQAVGEVDHALLSKITQNISDVVSQADKANEIERGEKSITKSPIEIALSVQDAVSSSHNSIKFNRTNKRIVVQTDAKLMQIILSNLLSNASKYSPSGSDIEVHLIESHSQVIIKVENLLNRKIHDVTRLQEKYYRDPSGQRESGTGLGLYINKLICDELGYEQRINVTEKTFVVEVLIPKCDSPVSI
jgi:signal transduction histidine kinase